MGRNTFYILSCGFAFFTLIFAFSFTQYAILNTKYDLRILTYEIINLFLQNEPKFRKSQVSLNKVLTKNYDKMDTWSIGKNEPKTNPNEPKTNPKRTQNEPKFKKAKMNVTFYIKKEYEKISKWAICENEPKTNPNSKMTKMNANYCLIKSYEQLTMNNELIKQTQYKPKQTQPVVSLPALPALSLSKGAQSKGLNLFQRLKMLLLLTIKGRRAPFGCSADQIEAHNVYGRPDGGGKSLSRKVPTDYGNDVANCQPATPSPAAANPQNPAHIDQLPDYGIINGSSSVSSRLQVTAHKSTKTDFSAGTRCCDDLNLNKFVMQAIQNENI